MAMTVLEQRFMQQVPDLLHDIAEGVKAIAEQTPKYVYVFTADQVWDDDPADLIVETFATEEAARAYLHNFVHKSAEGDISVAEVSRQCGWITEYDEPDLYRAFWKDHYSTDHTECQITRCEIKK